MKKIRLIPTVLTAALICLLLLPIPASADVYFTSVNDHLFQLSADTMPVWSGGILYVHYTVFDRSTNGGYELVDGLVCSYTPSRGSASQYSNTVSLYTTHKALVFDLNTGTCRDDITQEPCSGRAIIRNGKPYLPLNTVCSFFGLSYTYTPISYVSQGYLVRIKNSAAGLDDASFLDAAVNLINRRLREYNQSLAPAPDPGPSTTTPPSGGGSGAPVTGVPLYLAFRCGDSQGLSKILDTLNSWNMRGVFFLSPQAMAEDPDTLRRALGTGHSVGILAEGSEPQELLEEGSRLLEGLAYTRTTLALVSKDQRSRLEEAGWVCWKENLSLSPSDSVGANTFASNALSRLSNRSRSTCLTLTGGGSTARVLSALLRQLDSSRFVVSIPMETKL